MSNEECCRKSFGKSLWDSAKRLAQNPGMVPQKVKKERLEICHACKDYLPDTDQCGICDCFMGIKAGFANMRCADKPPKWVEYLKQDEN